MYKLQISEYRLNNTSYEYCYVEFPPVEIDEEIMFCFDLKRTIYSNNNTKKSESILDNIPTDAREVRVWLNRKEIDSLYNDPISFINRVINGKKSFEEKF